MKRTAMLAAALVAAASTVSAQDSTARAADTEKRQQVRMMETLLAGAVRNGAETLARTMQANDPGSLIVTGTARARGIVLDGYGVFFDVDVPMMKQSYVWSMRTLQQEETRATLRRILENTPDSPARRVAEQQLRALDRSAGLPMAPPAASSGIVAAATVNENESAPPTEPKDPNEQYTEAVKIALIDAMLNFVLPIGPDEWLIVAARDSEGPMMPNAIDDAATIVLRVKGKDLTAFHMKQITREEARKRVEVREN